MMNKITSIGCGLLLALSPLLPTMAQAADEPAKSAAAVALTDGEVRKIDRDAGKLTLRHGPIVNLDMQGMTMSFRVANPAMLDGLNVGDKVRFAAERVNGATLVTRIDLLSQ
jgi:Cu/Ag efflux protein CusF